MADSYREHFESTDRVEYYDNIEYHPHSYPSILSTVELQYTRDLAQRLAEQTGRKLRYLDFACGTGRVLSALEHLAEVSIGVDTSEAMLSAARARCPGSTLVHADILKHEEILSHRYDLITAFRFVLNAEPAIREQVLARLAGALAPAHGRLVITNHGNPLSHKGLAAPVHLLRRRGHRRLSGNYLTHGQVARIVSRVGLRIDARLGYGFLSAKALRLLPFESLKRVENLIAGAPWLERAGVNQLYVLTKDEGL